MCHGCKLPREIVYVNEDTALPYCVGCLVSFLPLSQSLRDAALLAATIPFSTGDRVEARLAGQVLDGTGTVTAVSTSLEHGATPVYPTFLVRLDEPAHDQCPDEAFYTENCLTKVDAVSS